MGRRHHLPTPSACDGRGAPEKMTTFAPLSNENRGAVIYSISITPILSAGRILLPQFCQPGALYHSIFVAWPRIRFHVKQTSERRPAESDERYVYMAATVFQI